MTIEVYSFEDANGTEFGSFTTTSPDEAKRYAASNRLRVRANTYEYTDSEIVNEWDYTISDMPKSATDRRK